MGGADELSAGAAPLALVVGDVMNDVVVRPQEPFAADTDTRSEIEWSAGGSGANQAAWLGYLSGRARFAGRAGATDVGAHRLALEQFGVDARIAADETLATGSVVVIVSPGGERSMFTDRGANAALGAPDLSPALLDGASILHVSGYALFEPAARVGVSGLASAARARGIEFSVDPASTAGLLATGTEAFFESTADASLIFPNLDEGRLLTARSDPDDIVAELLKSYGVVALKLGREGCVVADSTGASTRLAALESAGHDEGLDSTGAGDAFCAGFLAERLRGGGLADCAARAIAAADEALRHLGARPVAAKSRR